jgi:DNA-binding response OmpR family regulator
LGKQTPETPDAPPRTALVVEDDPVLSAMVRRFLETLNMKVVQVAEGREAIVHVAVHKPDLVCLDLMLPELSGYAVCEFMRSDARLRDVPILIMSARALPQDRAYAEQMGASGYLVKPFKLGVFVAAVREILVRAEQTVERA